MSAPVPDSGGEAPPTTVAAAAPEAAAGGAAAPVPGGQAAGAAPAAGQVQRQRRRPRPGEQAQEVVDELAVEERRTSLLDIIEGQLKGKESLGRLLFVFAAADDKNVRSGVETEFGSWLSQEDRKQKVTGLLLFQGQAGMSFLEGPAEELFAALTVFHGLASDAEGRAALIGPLRILYFTEVHSVRTTVAWCSLHQQGKPMGGNQVMDQDKSSELVFVSYRKLLLANLGALALLKERGDSEDPETAMSAAIKKIAEKQEALPSLDEIALFMSKSAAEYYFTFQEFEKMFMAPFHTVLHSELLWPMPPTLSY